MTLGSAKMTKSGSTSSGFIRRNHRRGVSRCNSGVWTIGIAPAAKGDKRREGERVPARGIILFQAAVMRAAKRCALLALGGVDSAWEQTRSRSKPRFAKYLGEAWRTPRSG